MAGFSELFIPNFASIVYPLRQKLKENVWARGVKCQEAFLRLQDSLSEFSVLHHYVIGHDTEVVVDARMTGLGAVLVQRASKTEAFHPVMYKSRALKEVETIFPNRTRSTGRALGMPKAAKVSAWRTKIPHCYRPPSINLYVPQVM